jgi:tRNA threonylcarbamoyladenosine biosynthesis protein TsaB
MNKSFPILAVETTGELCSVAALLDEKNFVEMNYLQKHIHSQKLMDMIDIVIKQTGILLPEYSGIAISTGPGSFTGLRIGMSAIKGLAFGANLGIIPVPTFGAFALQISESLSKGQQFNLIINASIDDCYFAKYLVQNRELKNISELALLKKDDLGKNISSEEINYGNVSLEKYDIRDIKLTAISVARWAYLFGKDLLTFDYDNLEPYYLKQFVGKVKK